MRGFQFPILQRETQGVLRRKLTFFFAFTLYGLLSLVAVFFFGILAILGMGFLVLEFPLLRELRWMFPPLFFSGMLLRHLVRKPDFWWIDKLTRGGS